MALRTSLVIAGDADGAKQALAETDQAMAATEKEAAALKVAYERANGAIGELAKAQALATAEIAESKQALAAGKIGQEQYNKEILETKSALALFQAEHRGAIAELGKANRAYDTAKGSIVQTSGAIQQVTAVTGAQRAGMQQLSMQLGDVSTMYALGAKPMQIFASQSGQVLQAVQLMTGGTSKLAAFLGGPWGLAMTAAAMVLVPLIGKLFDTADAADTATAALQRLIDKQAEQSSGALDIVKAEQEVQALLTKRQGIVDKIAAAEKILNEERARGVPAERLVARANGIERLRSSLSRLNFDIATSEGAITAARDEGAKADTKNMTGAIADRAKLLGATTALDKAQAQYNISIREAEIAFESSGKTAADQQRLLERRTAAELALNKAQDATRNTRARSEKGEQTRLATLARESDATEALIAGLNDLADAYLRSSAAGMRAEVEARAREQGIKKRADLEVYVAQQLRKAVAERAAQGAGAVAAIRDEVRERERLNNLVATGALRFEDLAEAERISSQLQPLRIARDLAEGEAKDKLTEIIDALADAYDRSDASRQRSAALGQIAEMAKEQDLLEKEIALTRELGERRIAAMRGMSGGSLEDELASLNAEREKGLIQIEAEAKAAEYRERALSAANDELRQELLDQAAAVMKLADTRKGLVDLELQFEREARAAQELNEQVNAIVGSLGRLNFGGGILGDIAGVLTSRNPVASLLGMGGFGTVAGSLLGGREPWDKLALDFESTLRETFGLGGDFSEALGGTLANVFQGLQVGGAVGSIIGGGKNAQMGSSIGGALGGAAGSAFLAGGVGAIANLGAFAGPVGAIAGAVLGSVLGGLLDTNRTANAVVTGSGYTVGGKDKGNYSAANDLGQAVEQGLGRIADVLGGTIGDFMVSIGMRGDQIRVNTDGTSLKFDKGAVGFGQDAAGAVMFAIADAIEDGALEGLSAGIKQLITNGGDLETQLQKALTLKGVMDEAERNRDPMAYDLNQLEEWKAGLVAIATEAGEGMAAVEEEYARRRQAILEQYGEDAVASERDIRELQIELLMAQGKLAKATALAQELQLEGLSELEQAYKRQIWAAAEAARVANSIHEIKLQVLDLTDAELALKIRREDQMRAATEAERVELRRLYAAQDAARVMQEAGAIADERARLERELLEVMGDSVALAGLDREGIDASNRALWDLINARRAEKTAAEEAAAAQREIADEHKALQRQWLELIGDTQALQAMDLADLKSDENRELQQQIWDYKAGLEEAAAESQRAAEIERNRADALRDAQSTLRQVWSSEGGALQQAIEKHRTYAADLRAYAGQLTGLATSTGSLESLRERYKRTEYLAGLGNEASAQSFRSDADAYLAEMRRKANSIEGVRVAEAEVARGALSAAGRFSDLADANSRQYQLLEQQIGELIELKDKTVLVQEAIDNLKAVAASQIVPDMTAAFDEGFQSVEAAVQRSIDGQAKAAQDNYSAVTANADWSRKTFQLLSEAIRGGRLIIATDGEFSVTVANSDANPVPTVDVGT